MSEQGFSLSSPNFSQGAPIPDGHTCEGSNQPPPLQWMHSPAGTQSFALIVEDPDAPQGVFTHWVKFDIPAHTNALGPGDGAGRDGKNDFQTDGYGGPCPPPNHGRHRYRFRLYALDTESLQLPKGAKREAVEEAMSDHVLGQTELMGTFERSPG